MNYINNITGSFLISAMFVLSGCGGDGSSDGGSNTVTTISPSVVSGTASQGAALVAGSTVYLKDKNGVEKTAIISGNDGRYSIAVDGLTAPFVLKAGSLYSFSTTAGNVNINPLTHLCMVSNLGATEMAPLYASLTPESLNVLKSKYKLLVNDLIAKLDTIYESSVPSSQRDFHNGTVVIGQGVDKFLENVEITSTSSSFTIRIKGQSSILFFGATDPTTGTVTISRNDSAVAILNSVLYPKTASVRIASTGSGTYTIQAQNMHGVAGIQVDIAYDTASLASPTVTQGSLISGAMMAVNTSIPGLIKIAIISTSAFSGSGQIASISFASRPDSNGITSIATSMFDITGATVPTIATNYTSPEIIPPEITPEIIKNDGAKIQIISSGSGSYIVNGNNITGVAGISLDITYDAASLSAPTVNQGWLVSGAMFVANTSSPGKIKIAIISTSAFSGSGQIATISFASITGSGGITSVAASMIDSKGTSIASSTSISSTATGSMP